MIFQMIDNYLVFKKTFKHYLVLFI